jgi:hypothetical protein
MKTFHEDAHSPRKGVLSHCSADGFWGPEIGPVV